MISRARVEELYDEHAGRLFGFLAYRTGDHHLAEDLLGDVFERALRAGHRYRADRGSESAWLYAIALNLLRDHLRRSGTEQRAVETIGRDEATDPGEEDAGDRLARTDQVLRAMDRLTAEEREIVALRFGADLTAPQIARATGLELSLVEGRLYRALRKLRTVVVR